MYKVIFFFIFITLVLLGMSLLYPNTKQKSSVQNAVTSNPQLSFGTETISDIKNITLEGNGGKTVFVWFNTNEKVNNITNVRINLIYDPNHIKSVTVEKLPWGNALPISLYETSTPLNYQGKMYISRKFDLGVLCTQSNCNALQIKKAPLLKLHLTSNNVYQESVFAWGTNTELYVKEYEGNQLTSTSLSGSLAINKTLPKSADITIRAFSTRTADFVPKLQLSIKGGDGNYKAVKIFDVTNTTYADYNYRHNEEVDASQIRVGFINDPGQSSDIYVDYIKLGTNIYQTEHDTTYATGTWNITTQACTPAFAKSEALHCNGYFDYYKAF